MALLDFTGYKYGKCEKAAHMDGDNRITEIITPFRTLTEISGIDRATASEHPLKHPVESAEDMKALIYYYNDISVIINEERLETARGMHERLGIRGITAGGGGSSPFMLFLEHYAGIENAHYLAADYPELLSELLCAIQRVNTDNLRLVCKQSPADALYIMENTSTTILSPWQFEEYCIPFLKEYCGIADAYGRRLIFHMCGFLKDVLHMLRPLSFAVVEAFTSPPVGNTDLLDGRLVLPDKCLFGGTNCLTWLKPVEGIIGEIESSLKALRENGFGYNGVILSTAGMSPPGCKPETFREVCRYVQGIRG
jgi:uroporphyrinogen-III decarboxylase